MAEPMKNPGQLPESYQPKAPEILKIAEQAQERTEKLVETFAIGKAVFELFDRPEVLWVGTLAWAADNGSEPDNDALLKKYQALCEIPKRERMHPDWSAGISINYCLGGKAPRGMLFAQETWSSKQDDRYDMFTQPAGLYLRLRLDKHAEKLLGKHYGDADMYGLLEKTAMRHGYRRAQGNPIDIFYHDHEHHTAKYAIIPVEKAPEGYQPRKPEILSMAEQARAQSQQSPEQNPSALSGGEPPKILRGVPKVHYGAFGGITPFPICLKAVSDYLGDELDYAYAMVASGGAFRFAWNTAEWDGGNVDIALAYAEAERPYRQGVEALGRGFRMLWRVGNAWGHPGEATKEDVKAFITEQIDLGHPVISLGPIGPAEAGIIAGYSNGGNALLGWSLFQWDGDGMGRDEEGYFITDKYWDEGDFVAVMSLGDVAGPRFGAKEILRNAIDALEGRLEEKYAKGIAAYDAWKAALLAAGENDLTLACTDGGNGGMFEGMNRMMMCQGDATDCLVDGRNNASKYFSGLAQEHPEQPLYAQIAEQFGIVADTIQHKIYKALGGYQRDKKQVKALQKLKTRQKIAGYIAEMKAADEKALALMKALLDDLEGYRPRRPEILSMAEEARAQKADMAAAPAIKTAPATIKAKARDQVRVIELPRCRMVTSGPADGEPEGNFTRFSEWFSAYDSTRADRFYARDFMWCAADGMFEWGFALAEGEEGSADTGGFGVIDFPGGLYAVAISVDADGKDHDRVYNGIQDWVRKSGCFALDENDTRRSLGNITSPIGLKEAMGYHQMDLYFPIRIKEADEA